MTETSPRKQLLIDAARAGAGRLTWAAEHIDTPASCTSDAQAEIAAYSSAFQGLAAIHRAAATDSPPGEQNFNRFPNLDRVHQALGRLPPDDLQVLKALIPFLPALLPTVENT